MYLLSKGSSYFQADLQPSWLPFSCQKMAWLHAIHLLHEDGSHSVTLPPLTLLTWHLQQRSAIDDIELD